MTQQLRWLLSALLLGGLLAGCQASCHVSTAGLAEYATSAEVDPTTQAPGSVQDTFEPKTPAIYATAKIADAPSGTKVKAEFYFVQDAPQLITENFAEVSGTRHVSFALYPPQSGWPVGTYEVRFFLDGEEVKRLPFSVKAAESQPAAPQPTAQSQPAPYQRISEPKLGITFEIPSDWGWHLTQNDDYLVRGPAQGPASKLMILFQVIAKQPEAESSLQHQFNDAQQQFAEIPGGKILKQGRIQLGEQEVPYLIAGYPVGDQSGTVAPWGHTQMIAEFDSHFLWISYSAPRPVYKEFLPVFDHLVETFSY